MIAAVSENGALVGMLLMLAALAIFAGKIMNDVESWRDARKAGK